MWDSAGIKGTVHLKDLSLVKNVPHYFFDYLFIILFFWRTVHHCELDWNGFILVSIIAETSVISKSMNAWMGIYSWGWGKIH